MGIAAGIVGDAAVKPDVFIIAVALVMVQVSGQLIVGHSEIDPAIVVIIGDGDAERVAVRIRQTALPRLIFEMVPWPSLW